MEYEEKYFLKPLFKKATIYTNRIKVPSDTYTTEELYRSGIVVEGSGFPPKKGDLLEIMFTSSLYGLYGNTTFIVLETSPIREALSITAIREGSEDGTEWNFVLEDTLVN